MKRNLPPFYYYYYYYCTHFPLIPSEHPVPVELRVIATVIGVIRSLLLSVHICTCLFYLSLFHLGIPSSSHCATLFSQKAQITAKNLLNKLVLFTSPCLPAPPPTPSYPRKTSETSSTLHRCRSTSVLYLSYNILSLWAARRKWPLIWKWLLREPRGCVVSEGN